MTTPASTSPAATVSRMRSKGRMRVRTSGCQSRSTSAAVVSLPGIATSTPASSSRDSSRRATTTGP